MEQQKKYDVFISYSRKDFDEVNAFVEMLKQRIPTLDIWFDLDGIESGDEFCDKIISAIKRSKYVLFALSKNSDQSEWTRKELGFAKGKGIKIVPVLLIGAHLQEMDWFLFEFSGVDCIDIVDQKQIDKLIKNLAKWTNKELILLPLEKQHEKTIQPAERRIQESVTRATDPEDRIRQTKSKRWLWILAVTLLIGGLGILGWNRYERQQKVVAEQHYQDSIRLVQQQDRIKELLGQDSIRVAHEKQRQDSISKAQIAEKKRIERMRQDSIAKDAQKKKLKEAEKAQSIREHNGHEYVDLGLSVMWATCNVGAESPEEYGDFFAWGEVEPKTEYTWGNYKYGSSPTSILKYKDSKVVLDLLDDAASMSWGGQWRMPTREEVIELVQNTTWIWITLNGVKGCRITSKINGHYIFLPATGYYRGKDHIGNGTNVCMWTSSLWSVKGVHWGTGIAYNSTDSTSNGPRFWGFLRYHGDPIRPVFVPILEITNSL